MKASLKVLFPTYVPYADINKDGKVDGIFKSIIEKMILYPLQKFNVTFVPFRPGHSVTCSIADCPKILQSLRSGSVDYYPWNSVLPQIYSNISLGVVKSVTSCHIWTRSNKKPTIEYIQFSSSSDEMERSTLVLINLCIFLPLCLIALFNGNSFIKTFFYILGSLYDKSACMYKQLIELTKSRIAVASTVWFVLFVHTIVLSNLRTGLMTEQDHGKVMNFDDFDEYKINPFHSSFGHCLPLLRSRIKRNEHWTDFKLNGVTKILKNRDAINVAIINDDEVAMILECLCSKPDFMNQVNQNFYLSPVIMDGIVNLIQSEFTPETVKKTLNKIVGSIYETGAGIKANQFLANCIKVLYNNIAEQSCLGNFFSHSLETISSLSINFFMPTFIAYLVIVLISMLVFLGEIKIG